ncbi:MAG TPA: Sec-independent protein translocase subunit TatB [Propionibacteriaceae bacterium]|nr:Sec-independent protein translocase subunit TatB [Propionibacteriaceae bacterium]
MDLGAPEIIMLVLLAVLMFGPEKIPGFARKAARIYKYLMNIASGAKDQLASELGPGFADLSLADLNPKTFLSKHLLDTEEISAFRETLADTKSSLSDTSKELSAAAAGITAAGTELVGVLNDSSSGELVGAGALGTPFDLEAT